MILSQEVFVPYYNTSTILQTVNHNHTKMIPGRKKWYKYAAILGTPSSKVPAVRECNVTFLSVGKWYTGTLHYILDSIKKQQLDNSPNCICVPF